MVFTKNSANAFAPSLVCCVASSGMIGGFSPLAAFGPVVGTSAGRVGVAGRGGPENVDECVAEVLLVVVDGVVGVDTAAVDELRTADERGAAPPDDVQAARVSALAHVANAAIVRIGPTRK